MVSCVEGRPGPGSGLRIVVMQLTIIGGGFLALALGSPAWALALLVVLKTAADAASHLRERRKAAAAQSGAEPAAPAPAA